jgi:hypothetical protein
MGRAGFALRSAPPAATFRLNDSHNRPATPETATGGKRQGGIK